MQPCAMCIVQYALQCFTKSNEDTVSSSSEFLESLSNEQHVLGCSADVQVPAQVLVGTHCSTRGWLRRQRAGRHQRGGTGSPPAPCHHHHQHHGATTTSLLLLFPTERNSPPRPRLLPGRLPTHGVHGTAPAAGAATSTHGENRVVDPGVHLG